MALPAELQSKVLRRDGERCTACGIRLRAVLAIHHVVPVHLGGSDAAANLTTLCANCHRLVHWLSTGDRILSHGGRGLGLSSGTLRVIRNLANRIRLRRAREYGKGAQQASSFTASEALAALTVRNGYSNSEAQALKRCYRLVRAAMRPADWKKCSRRLVRDARFISINAGNILVARFPSWPDKGSRNHGEDVILIWPTRKVPSIWSPRQFRRYRYGQFSGIPYSNIGLTLDECLRLTRADWALFRKACDDALHLVKTRRWQSNVTSR